MRGRGLVALGALALLAGGCRFGTYLGSMRGRGTATRSDGMGGPSEDVDATVDLGDYDLQMDYVHGPLSILSVMGAGGLDVRSRAPGMTGALVTQDTNVDFHVGAGVGYRFLQQGPILLSAFGLASGRLLGLDFESNLGGVYTAGVQIDLLTSEHLNDNNAFSARLGYSVGSATLGGDAYPEAPGMDFHAITFQIGWWFQVKLNND